MNDFFKFEILHKDKKTKARLGKLTTSSGVVFTPSFVPVGTQASVKALSPRDLEEIGTRIIFGNTYHLSLRPGEKTVKKFGGLAKFMRFKGVTMTDSGGFQIFSLNRSNRRITKNQSSLGKLVKVTADKVTFRSYVDGSLKIFTPLISLKIQKDLGADIALMLDYCIAHPASFDDAFKAMEITNNWASSSLSMLEDLHRNKQALYGIVQGSTFPDLRKKSTLFISSLPFDGIAIGGVAVGESKSEMIKVLDWTMPFLPENKIKHLLGVGEVDDIFNIVEKGIDTFDCVSPTRFGRTGSAFVLRRQEETDLSFRIDITKKKYSQDKKPLSYDCKCYTCSNFSRGYIHHLFACRELLGYYLLSNHNTYYIEILLKRIRSALTEGTLSKLKVYYFKKD